MPPLTVCIPAYNEEPIIDASLARVIDVLSRSSIPEWKIVVAENGSTDATADIVRKHEHPGVLLLISETKGKGAAIVSAARAHASHAGVFAFIDADLSADPENIIPAYEKILDSSADIVIGSRLKETRNVHRGMVRTLSSRAFNTLRRASIGVSVHDSQCPLKVMNARGVAMLLDCKETGWFLDMELLAYADRANHTIYEMPVAWEETRFTGRSSKLHVVRDGMASLRAMHRIRNRLRAASQATV